MAAVSWQAWIIKRVLKLEFSGWSGGTIEEQRARQERRARFARAPADIQCRPADAGGVPAAWIEGPAAGSGALLYLHGGGYVLGSIQSHRELVGRLARASGTRVLAIDYRLAPEHPFPAALEDAAAAYRWLLSRGYGPWQILIAGDSAGGGLALAALLALREAGEALPAGAVCISPWTDLALTGRSVREKAEADIILSPAALRSYARMYAPPEEHRSPLISPLYADLRGLPPLLIQVGGDEILRDDATRLAARARSAGVEVSLEIAEGMFHCYQMVPLLPEAKRAVAGIGRFVRCEVR